MNQWANTVLTDKGVALLAKLTQGNTMSLTRAITGAGFVTPGLLTKQTEVSEPKQELAFLPVSYPEEGKCIVPVTLKNDGLATGYEALQVGIYATDPDEGEILFIIAQAVDADSGTIVPSETEMAGYSAEWTFYFQYGQAAGVNVTVDPSNTVSRAAMESYVTGQIGSLTVALKKLVDDNVAKLAVPADWNQNDSTKSDFIKNRPFYETDPVEVVIAEGTIPAEGYLQVPTTIKSLTLGETYTVVFDGITYSDLTCISVSGLPAIGSADFSYTEYPFVFGVQNGMTIGMAGDGSSHTMRVTGSATEIIPLDRKYIAIHIDAFPGEKVEGKAYTVDEEDVTAGVGAEVFNDYETNVASGGYAHVEGSNNIASGRWSAHAEGYNTKATDSYAHSEGYNTTASGMASHAEGHYARAIGENSHAEGFGTEASGENSHAEGDNAFATGFRSHAEGRSTEASGENSHAEGFCTIAAGEHQHAQGKFNVEDTENKYAHIVGNGSGTSNRSNAHTVDWDGNGWFKGDVYVGGNSPDEGKKLLKEGDVTVPTKPADLGLKTETLNITYEDGSTRALEVYVK